MLIEVCNQVANHRPPCRKPIMQVEQNRNKYSAAHDNPFKKDLKN